MCDKNVTVHRGGVSLKVNMALNMIKGIMGILMPLITFPYVSRILGVENIGRFSFVNSVISYFSLLSVLGLRIYSVSVGPRYKSDKEKITGFANDVYTINVVFTGISYVSMFILIVLIPKFRSHIVLFSILSSQIILTTIGVDWINAIYEDYLYITLRTILFNVLQLVLLFVFVRGEDDLTKYAMVFVISSNGANVLNHFYSKRYCKVHLKKDISWKCHMRPILVLFVTQAMITIYVSSDITILGFMCNEKSVGIYHVSVKIYTIIKTIMASMVAVSIPRLSEQYGRGKSKVFSSIAQDTYNAMLTICVPAMLGLIILRREIIVLIGGPDYIDAIFPLTVLSVTMIFCIGAYFWGQAILVTVGHEDILFKVTLLSAVVNIVLNLILIPFWGEKAAAVTTLMAEALAFMICRYHGKGYIRFKGQRRISVKILCGCFGIMVVQLSLKAMGLSGNVYTAAMVFFSMVIYILIEFILKNELFYDGSFEMCKICDRFLKKNIDERPDPSAMLGRSENLPVMSTDRKKDE